MAINEIILNELDKSTWKYRYKANFSEKQMMMIDYIFMEAFNNCDLLPNMYECRFKNLYEYLKEEGVL